MRHKKPASGNPPDADLYLFPNLSERLTTTATCSRWITAAAPHNPRLFKS